MKTPSSLLLTVVLCVSAVLGQVAKPLTNQGIVDMSELGLPQDVILTKIRTSEVSFSTETADLKALANEKVSAEIVSAMVERQAELAKPTTKPSRKIDYTSTGAEYGSTTELKGPRKFLVTVEGLSARKAIVDAIATDHRVDRPTAKFYVRENL